MARHHITHESTEPRMPTNAIDTLHAVLRVLPAGEQLAAALLAMVNAELLEARTDVAEQLTAAA